jgi:hypothetical protein
VPATCSGLTWATESGDCGASVIVLMACRFLGFRAVCPCLLGTPGAMTRRARGVTPAAITSGNQTGHARLSTARRSPITDGGRSRCHSSVCAPRRPCSVRLWCPATRFWSRHYAGDPCRVDLGWSHRRRAPMAGWCWGRCRPGSGQPGAMAVALALRVMPGSSGGRRALFLQGRDHLLTTRVSRVCRRRQPARSRPLRRRVAIGPQPQAPLGGVRCDRCRRPEAGARRWGRPGRAVRWGR